MTMPFERYRAIEQTREFLRSLLDPKQTPKVPAQIRRQAASCLRHYPWSLYVEELAEKAPEILKKS